MFLCEYHCIEKCLNDSLFYLFSDFSKIHHKVLNSENLDDELSYREEYNKVLLKLFDNLSSLMNLNDKLMYDLAKSIRERDSFNPISDVLCDETEVDDG